MLGWLGALCRVHSGIHCKADCRPHECEGALGDPNRFLRLPLMEFRKRKKQLVTKGYSSGGFVLTSSLGHSRFFCCAPSHRASDCNDVICTPSIHWRKIGNSESPETFIGSLASYSQNSSGQISSSILPVSLDTL